MLNSLEYLKTPKKDIFLSKNALRIFGHIKSALAKVIMLAHPDTDADLHLLTDASDRAVAGALYQIVDGAHQPLGFYSRKLNAKEQRYSTFIHELLAVYSSVKYLTCMLIRKQFRVLTDYKPLSGAFKSASDKYSPREFRQMDYTSQFTSDVCCVKRAYVADTLSSIDMVSVG
ncbi:unnamed protein product [Protopolystoma xenopodis]|uniref:Reverse transcriptase/retrotransposon-derived protein RNase H-like domain-containing protein n=1 Tax=Protopolystoma xenopodis TaxID=117903 RepID=A0A448WC31_9PLAT|nr:unnamed protein product [Protopolystoma xenopodis]